MAKVTAALKGIDGVQSVTMTPLEGSTASYTVTSLRDEDVREEVARQVVQQGWGLLRQESLSMTLEQIFLRLTTEEPSS